MAGLIDTARQQKLQALDGFGQAASSESSRNQVNENMALAKKRDKKKTIGTVAGMGLSLAASSGMMGAAMATGPAGMMVAGVGLLVSGLL